MPKNARDAGCVSTPVRRIALELAPELNANGVHPARCNGHICTGCGICFYCCPEPGAITVYRMKAKATVAKESEHAPTL